MNYLGIEKTAAATSFELSYFLLPMVSLPIVFVLWLFRTYDTRQQIAKSHAQIQQGNFVSGLNKLIKGDFLSIDIGTNILIEVSERTELFNSEIRLAFIKRLQVLPSVLAKSRKTPDQTKPGSITDKHLSHIPHILRWIIKYPKLGKHIELPAMTFCYDEFKQYGAPPNIKLSLSNIKEILDNLPGHHPNPPICCYDRCLITKNFFRIDRLMQLPETIANTGFMVRILATRTSAVYSLFAGLIGALLIGIAPLAVKVWFPDLYELFSADWRRLVIMFALLLIFIFLIYRKKLKAEKPLIEYYEQNSEFENPNEKERNR